MTHRRPDINCLDAEGPAQIDGQHPSDLSSEATLRSFYDNATVMMGTVEITEDDIFHVSDNRAAATFFGTTPESMQGRSARAMGVPETYMQMWLEAYRASLATGQPARFDYEHRGKGWLKVTVDHLGLHSGRSRFSYVVDDITERKQAERALQGAHDQLDARVRERTAELERAKAELEKANQKLQHDAYYDALTGLPNRLLFTDRLGHALERYQRDPNSGFTVLFMDLDHFKVINDSLGHAVGDALLAVVARRLVECLREADTVARLGGDEFTVLLEHCDPLRATEVVERLQRAFAHPFELGQRIFTLTASVGVVFAEEGYSQPQDVLRDADLAMYHAKVHHSGRFETFNQGMRAEAVRRLELEADLRVALKQQQLSLRFQPIVRLEDLHLAGFEALVRWQHPKHGLLTPDAFIPLAEETGLIIELDRYVLENACRQLSQWHAEFPDFSDLKLNVNLSSQHFMRSDLVQQLNDTLSRYQLSPRQLNLEITENLLVHPAKSVDEVVSQVVGLGVELCIDDFGTGYSSLSYLQRFPAGVLKIDRSFIQGMETGEKETNLVEAILTMAQKLGMRVVAEGVETPEQREQLRALGCEHAQGYLFAKPLEEEQATALITAARALQKGS